MRRCFLALAILFGTACRGPSDTTRHFGLGRPASAQEIATQDIEVAADGAGLPSGSGSVTQGDSLYQRKCASCHGALGEGKPALVAPALIGRDSLAETFAFATNLTAAAGKTIGTYWPYATTVFDYVRRAMPLDAPGSLTNDEVYAITAYLLAKNRVIPGDATLDAKILALVKMPHADRFVPDDRRGGREVR